MTGEGATIRVGPLQGATAFRRLVWTRVTLFAEDGRQSEVKMERPAVTSAVGLSGSARLCGDRRVQASI